MNVGFAVAFFSRAKWSERLIGLGGLAVIAVSALLAIDKSMRGMTIPLCVIPVGLLPVAFPIVLAAKFPKVRMPPQRAGIYGR